MNEVEDESVLEQISQSEIVSFNVICRLCANPNERIIGIYSEEGISNNLADKMNRYLPVQVCESDYLPLQCCWSCASTVLAWHELYLASAEADRRLREIEDLTVKQTLAENFCDINEPNSPPEEPDMKSDLKTLATSLSVFSHDIATTATTTEEPVKDEIKSKNDWLECNPAIDESLDQYMSSIENSLTESDESLVKKKSVIKKSVKKSKTHKKKLKNAETVKNEDDYVFNFTCAYCLIIFFDEESIISHMKKDHPEKAQDFEENMLSKKDISKKRHLTTKLDLELVNEAKVVVEGRIYYNCKICGKSLHSPYTYTWHMRIHTGERPYICDLCGKQFRVSQGLIRHVRETHEGIKNYGCDLCGRKFATRRNVEEHRRIHTNERPYVCDLCGKSFKQKASLFVHSRSHNDFYPFRCDYCNLGFRARPPLLIHITKHTGEKPYPCDVCGRRFRIKYELKRHKLIHSEEKPFICSDCGFSFRQKRYLRNHAKANHKRDIT